MGSFYLASWELGFSVSSWLHVCRPRTMPSGQLFLGSWLQDSYSGVLVNVSNGCSLIVESEVCSFWGRHWALYVLTGPHRQLKKEAISLSPPKAHRWGIRGGFWFHVQQCRTLKLTEFISDLHVSDVSEQGPFNMRKNPKQD